MYVQSSYLDTIAKTFQLSSQTNGQSKTDPAPESSEPSAKRQKTSNDDKPVEDNAQKQPASKKTKQQKKNTSPPKSSTIILLAVYPDQAHLVAVTDDKSIRIFSLQPTLQEIGTTRSMPKRPCAIQIPPSNDILLVADKHGDVYSMPLIQGELTTKSKAEVQEEKQFKPSATSLTVHSKRNLTALQAQQAQKQFTPRKDVLGEFENTLQLGHVSMLTDMKFLSLPGEKRQWLATCDRDEHIRISRAPPQAHVIEGFCLGHEAFVSRVCQVGRRLISGGGDSWLGVWNFQSMTLERKIQLGHLVSQDAKPAVSGIWQAGEGFVFVLEKVESVFYMPTLEGEAEPQSWPTGGACLDVVVMDDKVVLAVDSREGGSSRLQVIDLKTGAQDDAMNLAKLNALSKEIVGPSKQLDDLLYNVANLRKRGPLEGGDAGEDEEAAPAEEE